MNKKSLTIILSIILVILIIIGIIIIINIPKKYKNTIFLGRNTKVSVKDNNLIITTDDEKVKKQNAYIYYNNYVIEGYILTEDEGSSSYNNNLHAYDMKDRYLTFDSTLIAYTKDLNIKFISTKNELLDDLEELENYFVEDEIDISNFEIDYIIKSTFDVNKDGKNEYIYSLGLIDDTQYYSLIIMKKDNKYYLIDEYDSNYEYSEGTKLELVCILDYNNDNNYEYIVSKVDEEQNTFSFYNFNNYKFNKIK